MSFKTNGLDALFAALVLRDGTPGPQKFPLRFTRGALVFEVVPDSPAEQAGLESGDYIVMINNKPTIDRNSLRDGLLARRALAALLILRGGLPYFVAVKPPTIDIGIRYVFGDLPPPAPDDTVGKPCAEW